MQDTFPLAVLVTVGLAVLGLTLLARVVRVTPPSPDFAPAYSACRLDGLTT